MTVPVPPLGADATRDDFEVFSAPSLVRFLSRGVQPPSQIYLKHTDTLQVQCASSQAGESVTFNYRLLRADSSLIKGQFIIQVPNTRAVVSQTEPMAEGFLLSLTCKATIATERGQTFARAFLTSGALGPNQSSYTLMSDYVTTQISAAHPNGRLLAPTEGGGWMRVIVGSAPLAGNDWGFNQPVNTRWRMMTARAVLTTSAVVANRNISLEIDSNGHSVWESYANQSIPASTVCTYSMGAATPGGTLNAQWANGTLPSDLFIAATGNVFVHTHGIDVADQWSAPVLFVEEWLLNV